MLFSPGYWAWGCEKGIGVRIGDRGMRDQSRISFNHSIIHLLKASSIFSSKITPEFSTNFSHTSQTSYYTKPNNPNYRTEQPILDNNTSKNIFV